jgi:hypothetical protein
MNSVARNRAGIASGVNNAVSRAASLLAIAIFGVVMLHVFKINLDRRLISANLPASATQSLQTQSIKLADIDIPENLDHGTQELIRGAIDESFVSGFRWVTMIAAALAASSAFIGLFWIEGSTARAGER